MGLSSGGGVSDLVLNGALIKGVPRSNDFPAMGYVLPEKVLELNAEMEQLDMNKLREGHDRSTQGAIQEVITPSKSLYHRFFEGVIEISTRLT